MKTEPNRHLYDDYDKGLTHRQAVLLSKVATGAVNKAFEQDNFVAASLSDRAKLRLRGIGSPAVQGAIVDLGALNNLKLTTYREAVTPDFNIVGVSPGPIRVQVLERLGEAVEVPIEQTDGIWVAVYPSQEDSVK